MLYSVHKQQSDTDTYKNAHISAVELHAPGGRPRGGRISINTDRFVINGRKRLAGTVAVSGAKNAAEAVICAASAADGVCVIENLPRIEDVGVLAGALESLGAVCRFRDGHTLEIDSTGIHSCVVDYEQARSVRTSYYLWGTLLHRFGRAVVPMPGGCNLGVRPIDQHIKGFEAMGAKVVLDHGDVTVTADKLTGAHIYLDVVSVGATINIMIAAACAKGTTVIENAAKEPHVVDTANFLNMMGAKIKGAGTNSVRVTGVERLRGVDYMIIPDQIETGTYMIAAAITGGDVSVSNIIPKHMDSLSAKLIEMNCTVEDGDDYIRVRRDGELRSANVKTMVYPGFPTDLQPQMTALLSLANGPSIVTETIYDSRFRYIGELRRMGCQITVEGRAAVVEGVKELSGAEVSAVDLRAGAALIVAGLAAKGRTEVRNIWHVDRGYEEIEKKLGALGASINRLPQAAVCV